MARRKAKYQNPVAKYLPNLFRMCKNNLNQNIVKIEWPSYLKKIFYRIIKRQQRDTRPPHDGNSYHDYDIFKRNIKAKFTIFLQLILTIEIFKRTSMLLNNK